MADAAAEPVPLSGPVVRPAPAAPPAGWPAVPGTAGGAWIKRHPTLACDAVLRAFVRVRPEYARKGPRGGRFLVGRRGTMDSVS